MRADHSCHCVRRPEHHPPARSNRVRRRVRDKPATQHRKSPGSRETGASSGGRNPAEQHPIPIHPLGAPWPPRSIQGKMLIAISESRRPRRNSVRYPVNAGLWLTTIPGMSVPKVGNSISSVGQLAGRAARLASRMTFDFEELDYRPTPIGALSLRRRRELKLGVDVFEIKLGDEFLMSSLFTASEIALARLGLAELSEHGLDVVVGGLGLGYTAKAVLEHQKVASLLVVEALEAVIEWHAEGLVPLGPELTGDLRCRFVQGDFFALAASEAGFDPAVPARRFDAVLVDIDHSPDFLLDPQNAAFYGEQGLSQLAAHLRPGGIFALWSNDRPDDAFTARLRHIFADARAEEVTFHNPLQDKPFTQTVYLAKKQAVPRKT